jgi:hypothetical protein
MGALAQKELESPDSEFLDCIMAVARPIPKKSVMTRTALPLEA